MGCKSITFCPMIWTDGPFQAKACFQALHLVLLEPLWPKFTKYTLRRRQEGQKCSISTLWHSYKGRRNQKHDVYGPTAVTTALSLGTPGTRETELVIRHSVLRAQFSKGGPKLLSVPNHVSQLIWPISRVKGPRMDPLPWS